MQKENRRCLRTTIPAVAVIGWRLVPVLVWATIFAGCSSCGSRQKSSDDDVATSLQGASEGNQIVEKESKNMTDIFQAQVAGQFYSADAHALETQIKTFLDDAADGGANVLGQLEDRDLVGVLSPHAGYVYSGPVAGYSFAAARARSNQYTTVIVMALSHRRTSRTISILDKDGYRTPLGTLPIDRGKVRQLTEAHPTLFTAEEQMFVQEHSLEVQLPFIQVALPNVKAVPMIVATSDLDILEKAGAALFDAFGTYKDILFVVSSDLSHFYPYEEAKGYDNTSLTLIEEWNVPSWVEHASQSRKGMCGVKPMFTFAKMFEQFDAETRQVKRLKYMNSGDTAGDKSQVVGYGSLSFSINKGMRTEKFPKKDFGPYTPALRRELMNLAKDAVRAAASGNPRSASMPDSEILRQSGAAFVTLKKNGQLRGCIGHVIARVPLYECVEEVARAAATRDTRFTPVTPSELDELTYEISILTKPEPIRPEDVVVGRDGLIMSRGMYSGLLLPQVPIEWDWDREQFLSHTCRKAGLPMDCWQDEETKIEAFRAIVFGEDELD